MINNRCIGTYMKNNSIGGEDLSANFSKDMLWYIFIAISYLFSIMFKSIWIILFELKYDN